MPDAGRTDLDLGALFDRLWPICRSITGPGIRESLGILADAMDLRLGGVPSGTQVLDWTVPPEWELRRARLTAPDGTVVADTAWTNLHVLNFSEPFEGTVSRAELEPHLWSDDRLPDAIPYVTSYYVPRWGFCLSKRSRDALPDGDYRVEIDTEKRAGELNWAEGELPGRTDRLILLTSYLCHPSMANNELSGPLALARVHEGLARRADRRFTYRFLLIPETIGSISYLARHGGDLRARTEAGLVLTCLGGPEPRLSVKLSRRDWTGRPGPLDRLARHLAAADPKRFGIRPFDPAGGSDERQFCSPGFDLPVCQAARTIYGQYDAYHTSADDLEFMTLDAVERSAEAILVLLDALEVADLHWRNTAPYGEPQLGRRGLYPTVNGPMTSRYSTDAREDGRSTLNLLLNILSLADGSRDLIAIAEHLGASVLDLVPIVRHLAAEGLLEEAER